MERQMTDTQALPSRSGPPPRTTPTNPHTQLDQQPEDRGIRETLAARVFSLPDVEERPTKISVPGARALWLRDVVPQGPAEAFMIDREFAHLHPGADASAHATLPPDLVTAAVAAGWAELHPVARLGYIPATTVMIFAPRNDEELDVVYGLLLASYRFAGGRLPAS
jgi:luciferase-like monooxygenase